MNFNIKNTIENIKNGDIGNLEKITSGEKENFDLFLSNILEKNNNIDLDLELTFIKINLKKFIFNKEKISFYKNDNNDLFLFVNTDSLNYIFFIEEDFKLKNKGPIYIEKYKNKNDTKMFLVENNSNIKIKEDGNVKEYQKIYNLENKRISIKFYSIYNEHNDMKHFEINIKNLSNKSNIYIKKYFCKINFAEYNPSLNGSIRKFIEFEKNGEKIKLSQDLDNKNKKTEKIEIENNEYELYQKNNDIISLKIDTERQKVFEKDLKETLELIDLNGDFNSKKIYDLYLKKSDLENILNNIEFNYSDDKKNIDFILSLEKIVDKKNNEELKLRKKNV